MTITNLVCVSLLLISTSVFADDPRYCGEPTRAISGTIKRSTSATNLFKKWHPCPVTNLSTGACPGWAIDHVIPLAVGGCDLPNNMQWLPNTIKSCAGAQCKDRWERKVYHKGF